MKEEKRKEFEKDLGEYIKSVFSQWMDYHYFKNGCVWENPEGFFIFKDICNMNNIHEKGYWLSDNMPHRFDYQLALGIIIFAKEFSLHKAVDIGCGLGAYVGTLNYEGINCIGYDGNPYTKNIKSCSVLDFSQSVDIGIFDLVISLEVGEHIPKKYEDVFIDNLTKSSIKYIIMSWAIIGQGGDGHVNCQDNNYIIWKFKERGFNFNFTLSDRLRRSSSLSWFKNTIMVYERFSNSSGDM